MRNEEDNLGKVVLAATPIGNMGDASSRLINLLETADIVAAEDTRRLYDLANRLGVHVSGQVIAYHDHNEHNKADGLLDKVEQGNTVLVVSDAGMPTINDPGLAIVRRAIERDLPVTCAPGPSAVLDALALSGLPTDRFCYEGFCRVNLETDSSICARFFQSGEQSFFMRRRTELRSQWKIFLQFLAQTAKWRYVASLQRILRK